MWICVFRTKVDSIFWKEKCFYYTCVPVLWWIVDEPVIDGPPVGARHAVALEVIVGQGPLVPVLHRGRIEVKAVVNVDLGARGNVPDDADDLLVLEAEAHGVRVAAMVEE